MHRPSAGLDSPKLKGDLVNETKVTGGRGEHKPIFGSRSQSLLLIGFPRVLNVHYTTLGLLVEWKCGESNAVCTLVSIEWATTGGRASFASLESRLENATVSKRI